MQTVLSLPAFFSPRVPCYWSRGFLVQGGYVLGSIPLFCYSHPSAAVGSSKIIIVCTVEAQRAYMRTCCHPAPLKNICDQLTRSFYSTVCYSFYSAVCYRCATARRSQESEYCSNRHYVMGTALLNRECIRKGCKRYERTGQRGLGITKSARAAWFHGRFRPPTACGCLCDCLANVGWALFQCSTT